MNQPFLLRMIMVTVFAGFVLKYGQIEIKRVR